MKTTASPFARRLTDRRGRPAATRRRPAMNGGRRRPSGLRSVERLERRDLLAILPTGIMRTSPDQFFTDFNKGITSEYTTHSITNDATGPAIDVWAKAVFPAGSAVGCGPGYNNEDGLYQVGTLGPGQTGTAFLYFTAKSLSATSVPYTLEIYNGKPGPGSMPIAVKNDLSFTKVVNTIEASPNQIDSVAFTPLAPKIGDTLDLTVTGTLGNGANRVLFAPATLSTWQPDVFELRDTAISISNVPQTPDLLFYDNLPGIQNQQPFTAVYSFLITRTTTTPTPILPTQFTQDGNQDYKHHRVAEAPFPPIPPVLPALEVSKDDGVTTYVPGTTTTYAIEVRNTGAAAAENVNITDLLPVGFIDKPATTWTVDYVNSSGTVTNGTGNIDIVVNLPALTGLVKITLNASILSSAQGNLVNVVSATLPGAPPVSDDDVNTSAPLADLAITKTDLTTTVTAGGGTTQTYTITVQNKGPSDARTVSVADTWPAGFAQQTIGTPSQGTVTPGTGGNFNWALDTLVSGGVATLTVTYTVPASTLPGPQTNSATVTSTTPEKNPLDNTTSDETTVVTSANLSITKTNATDTVLAGGGTTQTYTITVRNNGVSDAQNVVVDDAWPAGFTQGTIGTPSQGSVTSGSGGNFTWTVGKLIPGAEATLQVTYTVPASTLPTVYTNTATVTSTTFDPATANNTTVDNTTVIASADLAITKSDGTTTVTAGGGTTQTYTITVRNDGVSDAQAVVVDDAWPAGFTQGTIGTPSQGSVTSGSGGNFSWTVGKLIPGAEATLQVTYTVPASTPPQDYANTATVTSTTPDPNGGNNSATDVTTVVTSANLTIAKSDGVTSVVAGDGVVRTYTITVTNLGPSYARSVVVNDTWPVEFTRGLFGTPSKGNIAPGTGSNFIWSLDTLVPGDVETLTVSYTVPASTLPGTVTNTAVVSSATPDPDAPSNTATDTNTVTTSANLAITKTDSLTQVVAGDGVKHAYVITVRNLGPSDAQVVSVADTWPVGFTPDGFELPSQGTVTPGVGGNFTWSLGTLPFNAEATLVAYYTVPASTAPGPYTDTAVVSSVTPDPVSGNNTATDTTDVIAQPDLSLTKTDEVATVVAGAGTTQTYKFTVRNTGVSDARGVVVSDTWPAGFTQGTIGTPSQGTVVAGGGGDFTWTVGLVPTGGTATLEVTYTVAASVLPGPRTNTASVTDATGQQPFTTVDVTTVLTSADLVVDKDDGVTTATAGDGIVRTYQVRVRNAGVSDAQGVVLADSWPFGFDRTAFGVPSQGIVTPGSDGDFTWSIGLLPAGVTATLAVSYVVPSDTLPGDYVNTVVVTSTTPDPVTGNNTASDTTAVVTSANLTIAKDDGVASVLAGGGTTQTYTLTVTNLGASDARDVVVNDTWPAGFSQTGIGAPSQGSVTSGAGGNFSWSLGTLAKGATATLAVTYVVPAATLPGPYVNTATVTSSTPDPVGDNTATDTTTVTALANLVITKDDGITSVIAGGGTIQTYLIRVANTGASHARDVVVTDAWPTGFTPAGAPIVSQGTVAPLGGGNFSWAAGTIAAGAEATLTVTYLVPASTLPGPQVNTATVATSTPDANPSDTATDTTTVTALADLSITKDDGVTSVIAGGGTTQTYTITVRNGGQGFSDAQNVVVTDAWPAGFTQGAIGTPSQGTVTPGAGGNFIWSLGALPQGGVATLTVDYTVPAGTLPGIYTNTATLTSATPDPVENNVATDLTTVLSRVVLTATKSDGSLTYKSGGTTTWTIVVTNTGPSFASGVRVQDPLPVQVASASWTATYAGVGSTGPAAGTGSIDVFVDLAVGGTATFTLAALISDAARGDMTNIVTATPQLNTGNPVTAIDVNAYGGPINPQSDLPGLVIGSDDGCNGEPWVRLVDPQTGAIVGEFLAYERSFRGSVRVTSGDVTGDGIAEIIVGPGRNRVGEIRVFTPQGQELTAYRTMPFGSRYRGGVEVAVGDVTGDGIADIVAGMSSGVGQVSVFAVDPAAFDPVGNTPIRSFRGAPGNYRGGVMIAAGDVGTFTNGVMQAANGDGLAEIIVGTNSGWPALVRVFDVSGAPRVVQTIRPFGGKFRGGVTLSTARYDADERADILVGAGTQGRSLVEVYDGMTGGRLARLEGFAAFAKPYAAIFNAALDLDGNGVVDHVYGVQGRLGGGGTKGVKQFVRATGVTSVLTDAAVLAPPLRIAPILLRVLR